MDKVDKEILNDITAKYKKIIEDSYNIIGDKLIICGPIPVYEPVLKFAKLFSNNIERYCKDRGILYFDIIDDIVEDGYIDPKYKSDPIHASSEVLPFIENKLNITIKLEHITNLELYELKSKFNFNTKFKCYTLK